MTVPPARPDLDEFEREARTFLRAHAGPRRDDVAVWGSGEEDLGLFDDRETEAQRVAAARAWRRTLFDGGYGWISGPVEHGGRGLSRAYERAFAQVQREFDTPDEMRLSVGLGMVAPTIAAHGSAAAKACFLAPIHRADIVACQLFSEPGAGSDLAAIGTQAERDGSGWRITGQKVWTSGAHFSDIGMVLARTGDRESRHRGLTMFLIDMRAQGVEVRPLRQMTGDASFDEVFLTDVAVADDLRLGDVDGGWSVMMTTLLNERGSIGGGGRGVGGGDHLFWRLGALAAHEGRTAEPGLRRALADLYARVTIAGLVQARLVAASGDGDPGPSMAVSKLMLTANLQRTSALADRLLGSRLTADTGAWGTYVWSQLVLGTPGLRIGGGTDEVQRNMLAERVLGLPREPRVDGAGA